MRLRIEPSWLETIVAMLLALLVYRWTAAPDLYYTDCGELAGVCATLGVAHPTGYPLLSMIGYAWLKLPLPLSPIEQLNLLMAVLGAASVAVMHRLLLRFLPQVVSLDVRTLRTSALIGALMLMTARTVWAQALSLEVHALQLFLVVSMLYWLVRWEQEGRQRDALIAALVLGLALTNHLTAIVLLPGVITFALLRHDGPLRERVRRLAVPAAATLMCGLLYAYLPLRSMAEPLFNWGEVHRSIDAFFYHVLGKQYSVWMFSGGWRQQLKVFWSLLLPNVAIPFALWGGWILWRRHRRYLLLLGLLLVGCVGYVIHYSIPDIEPYFLTAIVALVLMSAIGLARLCQYPRLRAIAVMLPLVYTVWNWKPNDLHAHRLVREYVKLVVDPLPAGSILLSQQWDYFCSAFWYMQQVEGYRTDIVLVEKELLRRTWYIGQLRRWYGEPIERCSTEIAAYMPLLEEFESGNMPKQRYSIIQRAFVGVLDAIVRNNPDRYVFATPEVLETEPEFAALYPAEPFGATLALRRTTDGPLPPPKVVDASSFVSSASRYSTDRLDRGLLALASLAYVRTGDALARDNRSDRERARLCYRIAVQLDRRNAAALERLQQFER
jgi:hypothetical protein